MSAVGSFDDHGGPGIGVEIAALEMRDEVEFLGGERAKVFLLTQGAFETADTHRVLAKVACHALFLVSPPDERLPTSPWGVCLI